MKTAIPSEPQTCPLEDANHARAESLNWGPSIRLLLKVIEQYCIELESQVGGPKYDHIHQKQIELNWSS